MKYILIHDSSHKPRLDIAHLIEEQLDDLGINSSIYCLDENIEDLCEFGFAYCFDEMKEFFKERNTEYVIIPDITIKHELDFFGDDAELVLYFKSSKKSEFFKTFDVENNKMIIAKDDDEFLKNLIIDVLLKEREI